METRINLLAFALICTYTYLGIQLGDQMNYLINNTGDSNNWWTAMIPMFIFGVLGLIFYFGTANEASGKTDKLFRVVGSTISSFGFAGCYGIAVGPYWRKEEGVWMDGWLIFLLVGIVPTALMANDIVTEHRVSRHNLTDNFTKLKKRS